MKGLDDFQVALLTLLVNWFLVRVKSVKSVKSVTSYLIK